MAKQRYRVEYLTGETADVAPIFADQVRGEYELRRRGLARAGESPLLYAGLICWAALAREGRTEQDYDAWQVSVVDLDVLDTGADREVDPDAPLDRSPSPSPSPDTTAAAPVTGLTPA